MKSLAKEAWVMGGSDSEKTRASPRWVRLRFAKTTLTGIECTKPNAMDAHACGLERCRSDIVATGEASVLDCKDIRSVKTSQVEMHNIQGTKTDEPPTERKHILVCPSSRPSSIAILFDMHYSPPFPSPFPIITRLGAPYKRSPSPAPLPSVNE